ncbi:ABC transporter permease [Dehalobacterium formicoaceticum]|uniref:ABC transporter permease n=1 Tax=Dehalobacterium formicoaceticum TaxID=51515 RepID=A0ABT1Y5J7_9FIRM|nr:ABC transporter permease [Dehalobacterium formicoaceticum]MCR6545761.1 ABC transporter permease [Dehalobacterium formicoaceticum]
MYLSIFLGTVEQGLLWSLMVLGIYMTYRVLDYADLTVEGSFTLGAAMAARLIFDGYDPVLATLLAIFSGAIAGVITGILHTQFRIAPLLSGILSMIALYSINLRIMGKANISLLRLDTVISKITAMGVPEDWSVLVMGIFVAAAVVVILWLFLNTEIGLAMRATGDNPQMIRSLGANTNVMKIIGLSLSNALVALSGALVAQYQNFADVGMGIGTIVVGLASVIIGEVLFGTKSVIRTLIAVVLGSLVYRMVVAGVLQMGLNPNDLRLLTALIVTLALASPILKEKIRNLLASKRSEDNA